METVTVELLTDAEKEKLEKIRQLIRNIEERKPMAFLIGLCAAALAFLALTVFSYYIPWLDALLTSSIRSNQTKDFPQILFWTTVITAPSSLISYFLIFKFKNQRDEQELSDIFILQTTREAFRKLKELKKAQQKIGKQAIADISYLNDELVKRHLQKSSK